jgi:hypothetical protein
VEVLPDGITVKLGIWHTNTKSRRDRLTDPQRAALAELGWSGHELERDH